MSDLRAVLILTALVALSCGGGGRGARDGSGPVEEGGPDAHAGPVTLDIVRDELGTPHVFAPSLEAAFYGLGWATAEDRLYQMDFNRRFMRGRLAEVFSGDAATNRKLLDHDVRMRTLGFARHADAVIVHSAFPAEIRALLEAYARGVNDHVAEPGFALPPAFATANIAAFEAWTPADSLLVWERLREVFNGLDMDGEIARLVDCDDRDGCTVPLCNPPLDEDAAIVPFTDPWPPVKMGANLPPGPRLAAPSYAKASHGWAVHGSRTSTGKPVLAMDPKTAIRAPSVWYRFHLSAGDVDAQGIGIAGAPGFLIFWNKNLGHTLTAAGGDLADLFELSLNGDATGYIVDSVEQPFVEHTEVIDVIGAAPVTLVLKESMFGPLVDDLLDARPARRNFALRHVDLMFPDTHSLVGAIELMRAHDLAGYRAALEKWLSPGANAVYAGVDADDPDGPGHIAYHAALGIGRRTPIVRDGMNLTGRIPYDGSTAANDWDGILDARERPHVIDPPEGYLFSGNHLAVGSWYEETYAYTGMAGVGDTHRSLRLRYALAALLPGPTATVTPAAVHALHFDAGSETLRIFRDMLFQLAAEGAITPPSGACDVDADGTPDCPPAEQAALALDALDAWTASGAQLRHSNPQNPIAAVLVDQLGARFRPQYYPELVCAWNGSEGGISFLQKAFDADPDVVMADPFVRAFTIEMGALAWSAVYDGNRRGEDPWAWQTPAAAPETTVPYQSYFYCVDGVANDCPLDPAFNLSVPLDAPFVDSILSSDGSSGTGTVDFADLDGARFLVPPGTSEDPASPTFAPAIPAWLGEDAGDPDAAPLAPLSRALIEAGTTTTVTLTYEK